MEPSRNCDFEVSIDVATKMLNIGRGGDRNWQTIADMPEDV